MTSATYGIAGSAFPGLRSSKSSHLLKQVAGLRAKGVGEHVNLPQLVVCGDQSAGKSSVLEGITGLPFPRQDGVCTRFATEVTLEHSEEIATVVTDILPSQGRNAGDKSKLLSFRRFLTHFGELPDVIAEASRLLGIRGPVHSEDGSAFVEDVLRIRVLGTHGLHLTVVDLPGLIFVPNEEQSSEDIETVHRLVDTYLRNPRTIILAVVAANNDIATQTIIQKSQTFDKAGQRTVGILTKPDLINTGTEDRIAALAKNQSTTKLGLGYFLLKNPSPAKISSGITQDEREKDEQDFFSVSPWKEQRLATDRTGVVALRKYLQKLLGEHIEREIPKVRDEIREMIGKIEKEMMDLGEERPTTNHLRMYLTKTAMRFQSLASAALRGDYHGPEAHFFEDQDEKHPHLRFRAFIHNANTTFADDMRKRGQTMRVGQYTINDDWEVSLADSEPISMHDATYVNEAEMKTFVLEIYKKTRGQELPGNYNHNLLTELFHFQIRKWRPMANAHLALIFETLDRFVKASARHVSADEPMFIKLWHTIERKLLEKKCECRDELNRLLEDEMQQPITYNHYYTDNIQKSRQDQAQQWLKRAMKDASIEYYNGKLHISNTAADGDKLLNALQRQVTVNMDDQACTEALTGFTAYYKVARKTFVDNVCRQAIERHLLRELPDIFSPYTVATLTNEELEEIAGETEEALSVRKTLRETYDSLIAGLEELH